MGIWANLTSALTGNTAVERLDRYIRLGKRVKFPPRFFSFNREWNVETAKRALTNADVGNFQLLGDLCEAINTNARIRAATQMRVGAITAMTVDADHESDVIRRAIRGYFRNTGTLTRDDSDIDVPDLWVPGDWQKILPPSNLYEMMKWAWMAGFALVELVWILDESTHRWYPRLEPWNIRYLRLDPVKGRWYLKAGKAGNAGIWSMFGQEIEIHPGDGKWWFYVPSGTQRMDDRPWANGFWRSLVEPWLLANDGYRDWGRFSSTKGKGLIIGHGPVGAGVDANAAFAQDLIDAGDQGALVVPDKYTVDPPFEFSSDTFKTFPAQIDQLAKEAGILYLNGDLIQEASGGGSYAAAVVQQRLFQTGITASDAKTLVQLAAEPGAPLDEWALENYAEPEAPSLRYYRPEDKAKEDLAAYEITTKKALAQKAVADTIAAIEAQGVRVDKRATYEEAGVKLAPAVVVKTDAGETQNIAETAMNGAQVTSALQIVQFVAQGQLPRATGVSMLIDFFQLEPAQAERIMGEVGKGFVPRPIDSKGAPLPPANTQASGVDTQAPPVEAQGALDDVLPSDGAGYLVPKDVRRAAAAGLELEGVWKKKGRIVDARSVTVGRSLVAGKPLAAANVERIAAWFELHAADASEVGDETNGYWGKSDNPSVKWLEWQLHGGDGGMAWADGVDGEGTQAAGAQPDMRSARGKQTSRQVDVDAQDDAAYASDEAAIDSRVAEKYSHIDFTPTEAMADNAERGLELRVEFSRGGTEVGVARARDIKNRKNLSPSTVRRMKAYFDRHEVDKKGEGWGDASDPSAGYIAWLLWGGDEGYAWARKRVGQMNAADEG